MKNNHCELSWRFVFCTVAGVLMLIMASSGTFAHAQKPEGFTKLSIGDPAPNFDLPGVDDKNHTLASFADSKVLMIVFTCNHCPTAQAYESRLNQLVTDYSDKGFALVAISPNDPLAVRLDELGYSDLGDSLDDMKATARGRRRTCLFSILRESCGIKVVSMTRNQAKRSSPLMHKTRSMRFWQERKWQWRKHACLVVRPNGSPSVNRPKTQLNVGRKSQ